MATVGQTSVRNCANRSLICVCQFDGMAPFEQLSAWLRFKDYPRHSVREAARAATHISHIKCLKRPACGSRIHIPGWASNQRLGRE